VIIGAEGVTFSGRIVEIDNAIAAKNRDIRDARARIQQHAPPGMAVEAFMALEADTDIDAKIAAREQEVRAVQRAGQLQQRAGLTALAAPTFPPAFAQLLGKTFANVAEDAERLVGEHIARHEMQARGEQWLTEGLRYIRNDNCPFCAQGLAGVELIRSYRAYFSREYHALREEVGGMERQLDGALSDRAAAAIEQTIQQNSNAVEFWREYSDLAAPALPQAERVGAIIGNLRTAARSLLETKAASPLEAIPPGDEFTNATREFETLRAAIADFNASVAAANTVIAAKKRETQAANLAAVQASLARLKGQKARHSEEVRALCAAEATLQTEKRELEEEKTRVRGQLDAHTEAVIRRYGESINRYLTKINAGFRITTPTHTYRGGPPSTSYQIIINQNVVDLGDAGTPHDRPSFKNTLSAGDRSTLALAFFLAQLEQDANRARKIVVFDDPFTSLDSFRRNHTVHQIYRCGEVCAQVVVV
jgi:wobble nucleotide-excising tRNase